MAKLNLNTVEYPASEGFPEAKPAGSALVMMTKSELKSNTTGTGSRLIMNFDILDGEHKGSTLYIAENWQNQSADATRIGRGRISSICHAVGKPQGVSHSEELHNIPFILQWGFEEAQGSYSSKNHIVVGRPASGAVASGAGAVNIPAETKAQPNHVASTATSQPWNATNDPNFNKEELQESNPAPSTAPPGATSTVPATSPATVEHGTPGLSQPVQNPTTQKYEATYNGATYTYEADGLYHLAQVAPVGSAPPAWNK
ncbi:MAG: DUF669 domain-containing protein [Gammaproteobacteria bacterium]|nr:DUF669 domain-containing protein [Gammaproteobacteria bacterium]